MKTGVLLINLGTPDSPSVKDVRKYLTQFLNDPLVIDINPIARFFLVNFIIVPFRAPKSAGLYKKTWTNAGSPLLIHTKNLTGKLQKILGGNFIVEYGMRYQNPSIKSAFRKLKKEGVEKIIAIPLYPQYASSSTGSTIAELKKVMKKENFSNVKIIEHFFQDENFLNAWVEIAKKYFSSEKSESPLSMSIGEGLASHSIGEGSEAYDFFLFSYHGLPERQIFKECKKRGGFCNSINDCDNRTTPEDGNYNDQPLVPMHSQLPDVHRGGGADIQFCYRAACYETTRQLVKRLNIPEGKYSSSFQSRLDDKWLKPYSDKVVEEKAKNGIKKILVFSPAFVADCLETIYEIGIEYKEIFKKYGGEKLQLVESLNDSDPWVDALKKIIFK